MPAFTCEKKLLLFRSILTKNNLSAYVLRTADCHNSEYLTPYDQRVAYMTDFTGSNGTLVVTGKDALLWTDGRYFEQATKQLRGEWKLMKDNTEGVPAVQKWLATNVSKGSKVGFEPKLMTIADYESIVAESVTLAEADGLVDQVWDADEHRPEVCFEPITRMCDQVAGMNVSDKLSAVRKTLNTEQMLVLTALDDVAWLFNLRGSDIPYNPVFFSWAMITQQCCHLYVNQPSLSDELRAVVQAAGVELLEYGQFWKDITDIPSKAVLVSRSACVAIKHALGAKFTAVDCTCVRRMKASKNVAEQNGMRLCHRRDAVAMCEFLFEIEHNFGKYDELSAERFLDGLREAQQDNKGLSFRTISSYGPNGAVIHYGATEETNRRLADDSLYLVDSGGQYSQGTTDVTRTVHFGKPTDYQRKCYTAVLKGHISLAMLQFPITTPSVFLDIVARRHLWDLLKDYGHGTGHGVGFYLNVHEGPFSISQKGLPKETLCDGAVLSDEPGYYEPGNFGIRIENLLLCNRVPDNPSFFQFEHLTLVPHSRNLVCVDMLTDAELSALNEYHRRVRDEVGEAIKEQKKSKELMEWLEEQTKPFERSACK